MHICLPAWNCLHVIIYHAKLDMEKQLLAAIVAEMAKRVINEMMKHFMNVEKQRIEGDIAIFVYFLA